MDPAPSPPPQAVILQLVMNVWATKAAATFARLGIPDLLAAGPLPADVVAERAGANPDAVYRLLRGVATIGLVEARDERSFSLTDLGQVLRSDVPGSMRSLLIAEMAPGHWLPWGEMEHSIRTGTPATIKSLGKPAWEYYAEHPDEAHHFAEGMGGISAMAIGAVLEAFSFSDARLLVDVGGSHGSLLSAILQQVPDARGILFDLPDVVKGAGPILKNAGVSTRVTCQGGSFFEGVPAGGDTYLLKLILHDWNDDECVAILSACRKAMAPGGRIVVLEMLITTEGPPSPAPLMDLNMLVMLTGRERTSDEYGALFARAGLTLSRVVPTHSPFAVIEARVG
jgi:O-methyltransferase domain/Dimerisation domain